MIVGPSSLKSNHKAQHLTHSLVQSDHNGARHYGMPYAEFFDGIKRGNPASIKIVKSMSGIHPQSCFIGRFSSRCYQFKLLISFLFSCSIRVSAGMDFHKSGSGVLRRPNLARVRVNK